MNIVLTGGTGFIGTHLTNMLEQRGHNLIILTRNPQKYKDRINPKRSYRSIEDDMLSSVAESDAIINLAGENMIFRRWTKKTKEKLMDSRVETTARLVRAIEKAKNKPSVMISASAAGYYGSRSDDMLNENEPPGDDFAAEICVRWEEESQKAEKYGVRVVNPRFGVILERDGGALKTMLPFFNLFMGASVGSGKQYFPWIHMRDLGDSIIFALYEEKLKGVYNASSPNPVTLDEFTKTLGKVMNRPVLFRIPGFALKLIFGEGSMTILASLRLIPEVLQNHGFQYEYPRLEEALRSILKTR
ncbi:MAG: TIGR01777 family oxidoreductase [Balneolales bacterium]